MKSQEQLSSEVRISSGELSRWTSTMTNKKIREMRRDPTIFFARLMITAPILLSDWTIEGEYEEVNSFIYDQILPLRTSILRSSVRGLIDWGWQPFEKIFHIDDGQFKLKKLKPLLQDITTILVEDDGEFQGLKQDNDGDFIILNKFQSMLLSNDKEGTNLFGQSYMANAERAYDHALNITSSATAFDSKVSGAHWVIRYPQGSSLIEGVETDNSEVANKVLDALKSSGSIAIPHAVSAILGDLNERYDGGWSVELVESSGSGANFSERLARTDKEKVRAFGLPERAVLEGQFGTKAEAVAHADFALSAIQLFHEQILEQLNLDLVNQLTRINFNEENIARIRALPLSDSSIGLLKSVYDKVLSNPDSFLLEVDTLDIAAIKDKLGVPYKESTL